jgi:hypothetical protein
MTVSGIILYLAPPGRVARWTSWVALGLSKGQWQAQHTLASYLFMVLGIIHLFFMNWRAFFTYVKRKVSGQFSRRRETLTAAGLFLVIFLFTLYRIPPIISIMDLGDNISDSWEERISEPPVPHTEELSLEDIARDILDTDPLILVDKLEQSGFITEGIHQTLNDLAIKNKTSPASVFDNISEGFDVYRMLKD